jgi:GT2 family glycosyltransferase
MVRDNYPAVRLMENRENVGFSRANNQALRLATGRYLLLLNSDTVITGSCVIARLVAALDVRPDAAVAGPLLLNGDGTVQVSWARFQSITSELMGRLDRSQSPYPLAWYEDKERRGAMTPYAVDWLGGACLLVRAAAARRVGLLDENFFMYCEETEWCYRFRKAGWLTLLVPSVQIIHLGGQSSKMVPAATRARMYRSSLRLHRILHRGLSGAAVRVVLSGRFLLSFPKQFCRNMVTVRYGKRCS